jgi:hypothetical protein
LNRLPLHFKGAKMPLNAFSLGLMIGATAARTQ